MQDSSSLSPIWRSLVLQVHTARQREVPHSDLQEHGGQGKLWARPTLPTALPLPDGEHRCGGRRHSAQASNTGGWEVPHAFWLAFLSLSDRSVSGAHRSSCAEHGSGVQLGSNAGTRFWFPFACQTRAPSNGEDLSLLGSFPRLCSELRPGRLPHDILGRQAVLC